MARRLLNETQVFQVRESDLDLTIPPDPDAVYHLRAIDVDTAREVFKRHTKVAFNPKSRQREDAIDRVAASNELLDLAIVKWDGVVDMGAPAPCDLAHKLKLPVAVQAALIDRAQEGDTAAEVRDASFRQPA